MADIHFQIRKDNTEEFLRLLDSRIETALTAIGIQASKYAANKSPVDTGRLRDSMTSELDFESSTRKAVKVGSAVEYAIYQELGTHRFAGHHMIRDAAVNHLDEYKRMLIRFLKA